MNRDFRRLDRVLFSVMAVAWLGIGYHSRAVPGETPLWLGLVAVPAGGAIAVAVHRSLHALRAFVWSSVLVGMVRSISYISGRGAYSPLFVWLLVVCCLIFIWSRLRAVVSE